MKVLNGAAFLVLPEGVIFAEGKRWYFGELQIKAETIIVDGRASGYWSQRLAWIESDGMTGDERDQFVRLDLMADNGASFPLNVSQEKTLPLADDAVFLVYEDADLDALAMAAVRAKGKA